MSLTWQSHFQQKIHAGFLSRVCYSLMFLSVAECPRITNYGVETWVIFWSCQTNKKRPLVAKFGQVSGHKYTMVRSIDGRTDGRRWGKYCITLAMRCGTGHTKTGKAILTSI